MQDFSHFRFPKLYYALVGDPNLSLIKTLAEIAAATSEQRDAMLLISPQVVQDLYKERELIAFLDRTREVTCEPGDIRRWVLLTKGMPLSGER